MSRGADGNDRQSLESRANIMIQLDQRIGGETRYVLTDDPSSLMNVPDEVRKNVVFVGEKRNAGDPRVCGTAFFVHHPIPGVTGPFVYCVTARHTLDAISKLRDEVMLRCNLKNGGAVWVRTALAEWIPHTDSSVDMACLPFMLTDIYDHAAMPSAGLLDERRIQQLCIGIGDEVFLVGLFSQHYGTKRNIPLLRVGNIAAMPEEKIVAWNTEMDAYLVEARSIAGISGSPVFVHLGPMRYIDGQLKTASQPTFYILGLMHGHYNQPDDSDSDVAEEDARGSKERLNSGFAIVVPATKLLEMFGQERIVHIESELSEHARQRNAPQPD
jgi:hypothetical protein